MTALALALAAALRAGDPVRPGARPPQGPARAPRRAGTSWDPDQPSPDRHPLPAPSTRRPSARCDTTPSPDPAAADPAQPPRRRHLTGAAAGSVNLVGWPVVRGSLSGRGLRRRPQSRRSPPADRVRRAAAVRARRLPAPRRATRSRAGTACSCARRPGRARPWSASSRCTSRWPQGRKCFYTTPIKALSNQKYADLVERHGQAAVGLLTGDTAVNGDAPGGGHDHRGAAQHDLRGLAGSWPTSATS